MNQLFKNMKNCPFCGNEVHVKYISYRTDSDRAEFMEVECPECGTITINSPYKRETVSAQYGFMKSALKDVYHDVWQKRYSEPKVDLFSAAIDNYEASSVENHN